ncbi:MAG: HEPN domain-containing protein [Flavobacteriales bacterium]
MQSFRTETENPVVEKDIIDLEKKIRLFKEGKIHPEKFRSLRLARGVYGQRQPGVQMIRIKIPYGKITSHQLRIIADISDEYSNGNLHLTTRQDVQIHFVSLDRTPELWSKLEQSDITLREACGNTVRNVTASAESGIDPAELFDVTPYAHALFSYFLRKPFGQELGRKIKIAFSNSEKDTAFTFIHDIGFIPKLNERGEKGFKILVAGGLGAQPFMAQTAFEFLPANDVLLFTESVLRVFDRYGERNNRHKARLKYLVGKIGLDEFLKLTFQERNAIDKNAVVLKLNETNALNAVARYPKEEPSDEKFERWKKSNVFQQKQAGYSGMYVRIPLGNISSAIARHLANAFEYLGEGDIRITNNQGFLLRFIPNENVVALYEALTPLDLTKPGFDSVTDITACPGTDTCNLAISNSTHIALELEKVVEQEFPYLIYERNLKIKISGCMNSCGQHGLAQIGLHGSSFKVGNYVVPALQVMLSGGVVGNGIGRAAERIIKIPSKRGPLVLRTLLNDYEKNSVEEETFNTYYLRKGKDYFYRLLKEHGDVSTLLPHEYSDWGTEEKFETAIGVGECAGVVIDLVQTLFLEAEEKIQLAGETFSNGFYADSLYHSYSAIIHSAKALLSSRDVLVNTQLSILREFDAKIGITGFTLEYESLEELALQINKNEPTPSFAREYGNVARQLVKTIKEVRDKELVIEKQSINVWDI